jgi:pimeloyl-ACP methyl ester carboxylesterase/DNA-binding CsgD family transcriptional regulator
VWRHWLAELSSRHTLIRYDRRGCGPTDRDIADFSLEAQVADLEAVVDGLGLERFPLLGLSGSGPVAVRYARRHPERVTHLILYGSYARGRLRRPDAISSAEAAMLHNVMQVGWGRNTPAFRQVYTTLFIPGGTPEQVDWFNELQRLSTSPGNAVRMSEESWGTDISETARQLAVPTLVMHARQDAVVPFEEGRTLAALIPGARFVPLESKNHILLQQEAAWTQFVNELYDFLAPANPPAWRDAQAGRLADLTRRELEVLDLIARGLDNQAIADRLVLSPKAVSNHITAIFDKLQISSRAQAIIAAREAGLGRERHETA